MNTSRILAVDHVELESPPGIDEDLRWFYGELAQLEEVTPAEQSQSGILKFRSARIEIRVHLTKQPKIDEVKLRTTILVSSLDDAVDMCRERYIEFARFSGVVWTDRRIQLLDPAGNRIELKKVWSHAPI